MKKYILIKEYPCSPVLGTIAESNCYEHQPEYWEPVVELPYKVRKKDYFSQEILEIERTSDGVVFKIGDAITGVSYSEPRIIESFHADWNYSPMEIKLVDSGYTTLCYAKHAKKALFTTEDGVEMFDGDTYYYLSHGGNIITPIEVKADEYYGYTIGTRFSTLEKAQERQRQMKVLFTTTDGVPVYSDTAFYSEVCGETEEFFGSGGPVSSPMFSTREKCENHIATEFITQRDEARVISLDDLYCMGIDGYDMDTLRELVESRMEK